MTIKEFGVLADVIRTIYARENILPNERAVEIWYGFLKDLDYQQTAAAVQRWVANNRYAPTISDIRSEVQSVQGNTPPDWGDGYAAMKKAISKYGYMNEEDAINSLEGITKETVKRLGWMNICMSENEVALRSNFRDLFNELASRKKTDDQTPPAVRERIAQIREVFANHDTNLIDSAE